MMTMPMAPAVVPRRVSLEAVDMVADETEGPQPECARSIGSKKRCSLRANGKREGGVREETDRDILRWKASGGLWNAHRLGGGSISPERASTTRAAPAPPSRSTSSSIGHLEPPAIIHPPLLVIHPESSRHHGASSSSAFHSRHHVLTRHSQSAQNSAGIQTLLDVS